MALLFIPPNVLFMVFCFLTFKSPSFFVLLSVQKAVKFL